MLNLPLMIRGGRAFLSVVQDPGRLKQVFNLVEAVDSHPEAMRHVVEQYRGDPLMASALESRPRLGHVDLEALARLPEGTLGREFADFMRHHGLDPNSLRSYEAHDEVSFIRAHITETHDLWHVVTGFGVDVAGELGLQAFYLAQHFNPIALSILLAGLGNTLIYKQKDCEARMSAISRGWLLGRRARTLFGTDWKRLWSTPLAEVRASFGLELEPVDRVVRECESRHGRPRAAA